MTTTETDVLSEEAEEQPPAADAGDATSDAPPEPPALDGGAPTRNEPLWTRGILPLALPILSGLAIAVWVINLSRSFLAGGKNGALIIVMIVTISIMAGAALMSAASRLRTGSSVMLVSTLLMIVVTAGIITVGTTENEEGGEASGYTPPAGPPVAQLAVQANANTTFDDTEYTVDAAGIIGVVYDGAPGHNLLFDLPELSGFILKTPGPERSKVELEPGEYTIYCSIPGHRAQGMEASVIVLEGPPPGEAPPPPTTTSSP
ncbi:MAG: hypothetical protein FJW86_03790 [Actinobacteria bacterium]|nr:hypothetical protein [Actinomycetota bacterium]